MVNKTRSSLIFKIVIPVVLFFLLLLSFFYYNQKLNFINIAFLLLSMFIFLLIYFFILRNILIKPIDRLIIAMWKVSRGRYIKEINDCNSREFNILFNSFNNMVFELNYLKVDYYEEKIKLHDAELKYLQSQIKPHFFLNSLNVIYNLSTLKDYENIGKMAIYLGAYFQYIIKNEKKLVTLEEEIKHIKSYLDIHCMRIPDQLHYKIDLEEGIKDAIIPPLTIQPFIENSIIHGMEEIDDEESEFAISLVAKKNNEDILEIDIKDNGSGFPAEKLCSFQNYKFGKGGGHIGIWNVYKRLNLSFNRNADLKFYNLNEGGAGVKIVIPYYISSDHEEFPLENIE